MPDKKDRDGWFAFITGEPDIVWNRPFGQSKKIKQRKLRDRASNVSAWQDQGMQSETSASRLAQRTYGMNDEGGVDLIAACESSPVPSTQTVIASQSTAADVGEPKHQSIGVSPPSTPPLIETVPREPKPTLLRTMDNVSLLCRILSVL